MIFTIQSRLGQPFEIKIGVGQVIKGWDEGVPQWSLDERAKLNVITL